MVNVKGEQRWTPCPQKAKGANKMKMMELNGPLWLGPITKAQFAKVVQNAKPSVS